MTSLTPIVRTQTGDSENRTGRRAAWERLRVSTLVIVLSLSAGAAGAQYTSLEGGTSSEMPDQEALTRNVEEARWSAGPFRIQPWLGLRDLSYVRSQQTLDGEGASDQLTATFGAGLRAYALLGSRAVWTAHVLPEYVWWQDDESKDGLNGRYGMGIFGYANRVRFQISHRLEETQSFFSDEVQELTTTAVATSVVGAEVRVARGLHVFGSWQRDAFEGNADDDADFTLLDRAEVGWSGGLRLRSNRGWSVGVGARRSESEFDAGARNLSFDSEALTFDLSAKVRKFVLSAALASEDVTPKPGSALASFRQTFGSIDLGFRPRRSLGFELYAQRRRDFSVVATRSLLITEEQGARLQVSFGAWNLQLVAGVGRLEAEAVGGAADESDDFDVLGAGLGFAVGRLGTLQLDFIQRTYEVGLLGTGREVQSFGLSVQLGELARRLSVGEGRSQW